MKKLLLFTILVMVIVAGCITALSPDLPKAGCLELVATRPVWKDQILSPTELKANTFVMEVHENEEYLVLIMSPSYIKDGKCRFDSMYWNVDSQLGKFVFSNYCTDHGLVEYDGGGWNPHNHLTYTGRQALSDEQFKVLALLMTPAP
jgi:hypothetical protein